MNRKHTNKYRMMDHRNDDYVPDTPEERIFLVWPLTREIAFLSLKHAVEQRLQRIKSVVNRKINGEKKQYKRKAKAENI